VSFLFRKINDSPVKIINLGCGGGEYSQQRQQGRQEGGEGGAEEGPQPNSDTPGRACALSAGGQVRYTPPPPPPENGSSKGALFCVTLLLHILEHFVSKFY
jgi:hypothetical protein